MSSSGVGTRKVVGRGGNGRQALRDIRASGGWRAVGVELLLEEADLDLTLDHRDTSSSSCRGHSHGGRRRNGHTRNQGSLSGWPAGR